jgi:hypothetical protein
MRALVWGARSRFSDMLLSAPERERRDRLVTHDRAYQALCAVTPNDLTTSRYDVLQHVDGPSSILRTMGRDVLCRCSGNPRHSSTADGHPAPRAERSFRSPVLSENGRRRSGGDHRVARSTERPVVDRTVPAAAPVPSSSRSRSFRRHLGSEGRPEYGAALCRSAGVAEDGDRHPPEADRRRCAPPQRGAAMPAVTVTTSPRRLSSSGDDTATNGSTVGAWYRSETPAV